MHNELYDGHCPICSDDDLEQINGTIEQQDLKCSNGHIFEISCMGWEIIKKGVKNGRS